MKEIVSVPQKLEFGINVEKIIKDIEALLPSVKVGIYTRSKVIKKMFKEYYFDKIEFNDFNVDCFENKEIFSRLLKEVTGYKFIGFSKK